MAYSSFSKQLDQVKDQFQDLSTKLEDVCKKLKKPGSPPPSEILEEINNAIANFEEMKSSVTEWAQSVQMPDTEAQELNSIKAIKTFSENIAAHQGSVQDEKVSRDISRARSIQYAKEGESFPPLDDFLRKLDKLENRVSTSPISDEGQNDRTQIFENKHPINYVLKLLEPEYELDFENHGQDLEIISREYGPTFMGVVATPGSLILPDLKGPQPPPPDAEEKPKKPEQKSAEDLEKKETEPEDATDLDDVQEVATQDDDLSSETHTDSSEESDASDVEDIQLTDAEKIEAEIAVALERGRFGIAYHLARTTPGVLPSFHAVKFIASNYVTDKDSPVDSNLLSGLAYKIRDEVLEILNEKPDSVQHSYAALMTSAALTPALTTHSEPIALLLESLDPHLAGMPSLRTLAQTVVKASRPSINIPVEQLHGGNSFEKWIQEARALQKEGKDWIENERQLRMNFIAARDVRDKILDIWEKLLVRPSVKEINITAIASAAKHWQQNGEREIDNIDKENRGSRTSNNPIRSTVRTNLLNKISDVLTFADRWGKLGTPPNEGQEFVTQLVNELRDAAQEHGSKALKEVAKIETSLARIAENRIQQYLDKFKKADIQTPDSRLRLRDLLNEDLLAEPSVMLDDAGHPKEPVTPELLLRLAKQDEPNFQTGIIKRAKKGDFQGANEALDFVERRGHLDENDIDSIRTQVEEERSCVEKELKDKTSEIGNRLDIAYAQGILTAEDTDIWRTLIPNPTSFSQVNDFKPFFNELDDVEEFINKANQKRCDEMNKRLSSLKKAPEEAVKRIKDAIQHGRLQVAEDYIERIENNDALPDPDAETEDRSFDLFFPTFVKKYDDFQRRKLDAITLIRDAIKECKCAGPVDATHLSQNIVHNGLSLIDAWTNLKNKMIATNVKNFMEKLGFKDVAVSRNKVMSTEEIVYTLETEPIANRSKAQLPDFGSRANGRYRLVVIRNRSTIESIFQAVDKGSVDGHSPNVVLFLNFIDKEERLSLAKQFGSGDLHPTVVLDDALLTFLAVRPSDQWIVTFFDCASAFTFSQPFNPNASEVPPEMFFGRKKEREKIVALDHRTHFVYGGRRIGKTALLKDIAREYQSRGPDQLGLFLDLRDSGIGTSQSTNKLWDLFADELAQHNIVGPKAVRFETIEDRVKQWLKEKRDERRILLLVDEADDFLEADRDDPRNPYRVLNQFNRLMMNTHMQFKVVFAGLHNVQRTVQDPRLAANNPNPIIGQWEDPVQIGPMLPETDPNEIENLIRSPLEALGYRFASDDSLIHIAAEMNYYPALAQQFCRALLSRLVPRPQSDKGPPYEILPEVVDEVFHSKETRDSIRNLFQLTIRLDPKYYFLTYLIARESFGDNDVRLNSVSIDDIRDTALRQWSHGFEDKSNYMFEVLLDEMVGLGILREEKDKKFAIRTRNLRMLLGDNDEIARRFSDAREVRLAPKPTPSQFRRVLSDRRLSSLTAGHEGRLLSSYESGGGVGLIFGTRLAGLDRVRESLEVVKQQELLELYDTKADAKSLDSQLRQVAQGRAPGIHIVFIDMRDAGNTDWTQLIKGAFEFVGGLQSSQRTIRPIFLGGPSEAWAWMETKMDPPVKRNAELWDIWLGPCDKGFAHAWLRDKEAPALLTDLESGNPPVYSSWPVVVEAAAGKLRPKTMSDATKQVLDNEDIVSDVLDVPEVKPALRILWEFHREPEPIETEMFFELMQEQNQLEKKKASRILDWASRLGIVFPEENGYRLDTAYATGLKTIFKE